MTDRLVNTVVDELKKLGATVVMGEAVVVTIPPMRSKRLVETVLVFTGIGVDGFADDPEVKELEDGAVRITAFLD